MKKRYLVASILAAVLLAIGCAPAKVGKPIPLAAISEVYVLNGTDPIGKYVEVKDVQDRDDLCYIMVYIKSLPGEFTTLQDALPQAKAVTRTVVESAVAILKKYNINEPVSVWVQLPLQAGGVTVLGHVEYDGKNYKDFEVYKP